jgi:hypothetical protein
MCKTAGSDLHNIPAEKWHRRCSPDACALPPSPSSSSALPRPAPSVQLSSWCQTHLALGSNHLRRGDSEMEMRRGNGCFCLCWWLMLDVLGSSFFHVQGNPLVLRSSLHSTAIVPAYTLWSQPPTKGAPLVMSP